MAADLKDLAANKPNAHELEPLKKVAASMAKYFGPHTALHIPVFKYQNTPLPIFSIRVFRVDSRLTCL
jgi:hypothetical protein